MIIGTKIRQYRELKNLTREQMADLLDISVSTFKKIEYNERQPTLDEIKVISEKLEIDPFLFFEQGINISNGSNSPFVSNGNGHIINDTKLLSELVDSNREVLDNLKAVIAQNNKMLEALMSKLDK